MESFSSIFSPSQLTRKEQGAVLCRVRTQFMYFSFRQAFSSREITKASPTAQLAHSMQFLSQSRQGSCNTALSSEVLFLFQKPFYVIFKGLDF